MSMFEAPCGCSIEGRCEAHREKMKLVGGIYEDPTTPGNVLRAIYEASDGFGPGADPDRFEWDRSAIRDSNPEGVEAMYSVALAYQKLSGWEPSTYTITRMLAHIEGGEGKVLCGTYIPRRGGRQTVETGQTSRMFYPACGSCVRIKQGQRVKQMAKGS